MCTCFRIKCCVFANPIQWTPGENYSRDTYHLLDISGIDHEQTLPTMLSLSTVPHCLPSQHDAGSHSSPTLAQLSLELDDSFAAVK
jgi:hypothetical protein